MKRRSAAVPGTGSQFLSPSEVYSLDYSSASEADFAACIHIALLPEPAAASESSQYF